MSSVAISESGEDAQQKLNSLETPQIELYVGDIFEIVKAPPQYQKVKGTVYYMDDEQLKILPESTPHMLIDISTDIFGEDPETTEIKYETLAYKSFVRMAGLKEGNDVQAFTEKGEPAGVYHIQSADEETDTAVFVDQDGVSLPLEFKVGGIVVGIPSDVPFSVVRAQEVEKPKKEEEGQEEENTGIVLTEDLLEEGPEEDEGEITYGQMRPQDIIHPDIVQKNDFIEMERAALNPEKRNNPKILLRIRRLMENCIQLRNDIIEYKEVGQTSLKPITYETLSNLLQETQFPLAKEVLGVYKTLYLDHSLDYYTKDQEDPTEATEKSLELAYLADVVEGGIAFLKSQFELPIPVGGIQGQLPRFYTIFQNFYNSYFQVMGALDPSKQKSVSHDHDFFRINPLKSVQSEDDSGESQLPKLFGLNHVPGESKMVSTNDIKEISLSYMRTIKPRMGKFNDGKLKLIGTVEQGDEVDVWLYILFPFLFLRDLGAIRSGKLSIDIGNGSTNPKTMQMILEEGGGIKEISEKGTILAVDPQGITTGNIELQDWLKAQDIYGNGIGDLLPYLRSIGLGEAEFTPYQQEILIKKIQFYQANLKKFLSETRKKANEVIRNPTPVQNFSFLPEAEQKIFLEKLVGSETLLIDALGEFKLKYPSWKDNDMGIFSFLYNKYPDYVLASLSGLPTVAEERIKVLNDMDLKALQDLLLYRQKVSQQGDEPVVNTCPHVKNLADIRKIQDDDQRIQVMVRLLLPQFKGKTEDHWIECRRCKQHLMCEHEYLMILEKTHPKEKDNIHKRILYNYSDGVFNGKYICGNCGQSIQELEFDQNPEFDDEGRVMMGNEPITEEMEMTFEKELEKLLEVKSESFTTKTKSVGAGKDDEQMEQIKLLDEMANTVGVSLSIDQFQRMNRLVSILLDKYLQKNMEKYNKDIEAQKAKEPKKRFPDYSQYKSQTIIIYCAAVLFIEIQATIPNPLLRSVVTGCDNPTFEGYPLIPSEDQIDGLNYMACVVASLLRNEKPWGDTFWASAKGKVAAEKLKAIILLELFNAAKHSILVSEIQTLLESKRAYIVGEKGEKALLGRYSDIIPSDFLPLPLTPSEELMKKAMEPLVGDAANPSQKSFAWLLEGYKLAKQNGKYEAGNPLSEATCCYSVLNTPGQFWAEQSLPKLDPKEPPRGPHGSMLLLKSEVRKPEHLLGEPDPKLMYRLFLRVCFQGPRIGLPHEPGYDNKCPYCEFVFPVDPRLPPPQLSYSKDKGVQKQYDKEYQTEVQQLYNTEIRALQEFGAITGEKVSTNEFEPLLQATNANFIIPPLPPKPVATNLQTIDGYLSLATEPFTGFRDTMSELRAKLQALPPGAADDEVRIAYADISNKQREFSDKISEILVAGVGDKERRRDIQKEWNILWDATPQVLSEMLRTFFLLPFQRLSVPEFKFFDIANKKLNQNRNAIYSKIALEERQTIMAFLGVHVDFINFIKKKMESKDAAPYKKNIDAKIEQFLERLSVVIPNFSRVLRANVLPYGSIGLPYIQRAIFAGMLWEFINPAATGGKLVIRDMILFCFEKAQERDENTILTEQEIRKIIQDSIEQEKQKIIRDLDKMSPAEKRAELIQKSIGMGRWAMTDVLTYTEGQSIFEKVQRLGFGMEDFEGLTREQIQAKLRKKGFDSSYNHDHDDGDGDNQQN